MSVFLSSIIYGEFGDAVLGHNADDTGQQIEVNWKLFR